MFVLYLESSELLLFIGNFFGIFRGPKICTKTWIFQYFVFFSKRKGPNDIFLIQHISKNQGYNFHFGSIFPRSICSNIFPACKLQQCLSHLLYQKGPMLIKGLDVSHLNANKHCLMFKRDSNR